MRALPVALLAIVLAGCDDESTTPATTPPPPASEPAPEPEPEPTPEPTPEPEPEIRSWHSEWQSAGNGLTARLVATCDPFRFGVEFNQDPRLWQTGEADGLASTSVLYATAGYNGDWNLYWNAAEPTTLQLSASDRAQPGFATDNQIVQQALSGLSHLSLQFTQSRPTTLYASGPVIAPGSEGTCPVMVKACLVNGIAFQAVPSSVVNDNTLGCNYCPTHPTPCTTAAQVENWGELTEIPETDPLTACEQRNPGFTNVRRPNSQGVCPSGFSAFDVSEDTCSRDLVGVRSEIVGPGTVVGPGAPRRAGTFLLEWNLSGAAEALSTCTG